MKKVEEIRVREFNMTKNEQNNNIPMLNGVDNNVSYLHICNTVVFIIFCYNFYSFYFFFTKYFLFTLLQCIFNKLEIYKTIYNLKQVIKITKPRLKLQ